MKIIDLDDSHQPLYFLCLEDWSDEMKEAGNHKSLWYGRMKDRGLRVKLALDDEGNTGGMIQYLPIEHSFAQGGGLYLVYCIWVHGYKKGRGNFQKRGFGTALLEAAEEDAKSLGARGMAAWGISLPFWMKASWFRKHGYRKTDNDRGAIMMWKPFYDDAVPPRWIKRKKKPDPVPGRVTVTSFKNGWCPAQNLAYERAKRAVQEFGGRAVFREFDTLDRNTMNEWGIADALFIDGDEVRTGPPPSYEKIRKKIGKRVRKLS